MTIRRSFRGLYWGISLLALIATGCTTAGGEKSVQHPIPRLYGAEDPQFARTMGALLGPGLLEGNRVDMLLNGDEIFPAMLQAIRGAKKTITFETFIYWSGSIGKEFADALAERARAGVNVHVLLDWVGSNKMDASQLTLMEQAGVQVRKYHELHWYGHEVHTAHDGLEAVDAATKCQPEVILIDIGLPGLDGYEAARRIREQQRNSDVKLVALSELDQEEDRRRSEEAGFDAHMVKPVSLDAISRLLGELRA